MLSALQWLTVLMGAFATIVPSYFAFYFWRDGHGRIGRVLSYMLAGEAVSMFAATWFAYHSAIEVYNLMTPGETLILRWIIFATGFFSTAHLIHYLIKKQRTL